VRVMRRITYLSTALLVAALLTAAGASAHIQYSLTDSGSSAREHVLEACYRHNCHNNNSNWYGDTDLTATFEHSRQYHGWIRYCESGRKMYAGLVISVSGHSNKAYRVATGIRDEGSC
jgi:hypothetical protein